MQATVVIFPGSNADAELVRTLRDVMQVDTKIAWHRDAELPASLPRGIHTGHRARGNLPPPYLPPVTGIIESSC